MSWNPVLSKFVEIKNEYRNTIGEPTYSYKAGYTNESQTCLERWIEELNEKHPSEQYRQYEDLISCLEMNQWNKFLLIKYARYSNVYDGEIDTSGEDFWDRYGGFYRECRSVVIDVINDSIVLAPFKKFFNINELEETSLDNIERRIPVAYHDNVKRVANIVINYIQETENMVREYLNAAPKSDRKEFMIWVDSNVPKKYRGFCKSLYLGKPINVIRKHDNSGYLKLKDMGVEDYKKVFTEEEDV